MKAFEANWWRQTASRNHRIVVSGGKLQSVQILASALALLGVFYFYSGFSEFALDHNLLPVTPGQVIIVMIILGGIVGLFQVSSRQKLPWSLAVVAGLYLALIALNATFNDHIATVVRSRVAFMLALVALAMAVRGVRNFRSLITALTYVTATACLLNVVEYFARNLLPWEMSPIPGRAAGFHINPNISATYITLSIPLICAMARRKVVVALYVLTFCGVLVTFSRSGMIFWMTAVFMTEMFIRNRRSSGRNAAIVALIFGLVAVTLVAFGHVLAEVLADLLGGYLSPGLRSRLSPDTHDFAAQQRLYGAGAAWELFLAFPWTGSGLGLPGRWQFNEMSHNMVLQTLAEFGALGAVWLGIFALWLTQIRGPFGMTFALLWALNSMFSHNLFDQIPMALITALYWVGAERSQAIYKLARRDTGYSNLPPRSRRVAV